MQISLGLQAEGLCECGCGMSTRVSTKTVTEKGWVKGQPLRYVNGHNGRMPEEHKAEVQARIKTENAARCRDYQARNVERVREWNRQNYAANAEKYRERARVWQREHLEEMRDPRRLREARRRALKRSVFVEDVHPLVVLEMDDGTCGICGEDVDPDNFHVDHIIPLACGGEHGYFNVQVAHPSCNVQKGGWLK